ncbi:MAG: glycoside hydrolase family 127 protein, partial [Armatimonadetes bacterium]|nr:glycoside hydrolase family 127 protein [Candidatus Hippobium faecium]
RFDEKYYHDLYILGHFIEFVVAHYEVFGDRTIVEACKKWIDTMIEEYEKGNPYYKKVKQCEHSEIELGLVRFYRITGEKKYLDFAITIAKMFDVTPKLGDCIIGAGDRHVVRVHYLLMGMLEAYLETGKDELFANVESLVNEILDTRMYITGGVGSNEWYPKEPYILPQTGDIAETCGSTSLSMLLWRLFQISPKAKYLNALELIFHNHLLASLNKDQDAIFYYNPIKSKDNISEPHKRIQLPTVHACSCCFPNIWRFFAQLPEYIFSVGEDCIYVNYYASAEADIDINGKTIHIETETDFPASGRMTVRVSEPVKMKIKKPYYATTADFRVTGTYEEEGYFVFENPGYIGFGFDYRIKLIETSDKVQENTKQVAITRGPIVYVLERDQKEGSLDSLILMTDRDIEFKDGRIYAWFTERKPKDRLYFEYNRPIRLELIPFNEIANKDCITEWSVFLNIQ